SGHPAARRSLREEMGSAVDFHRTVFRTAAGLGAARRRHLRDVVLAVPDRQFRLGAGVVGSAFAVWRRDGEDRRMAVAHGVMRVARRLRNKPPGRGLPPKDRENARAASRTDVIAPALE